MLANRSMPEATVIPVLGYADLGAAVAWLCGAFGFSERLRIGDHRAQLTFGAGAVVAARRDPSPHELAEAGHSVMVRVEDVDAHCARAVAYGARIVQPPATYPYGERQYSVLDPGGHTWTFSQSVADVHPGDWGGVLSGPDGGTG